MATFIQNRKAYFNYEIAEKIEAGIELLGFEVKSIKNGRGSLDGSYVSMTDKEAFLVGANISPYQPKNTPTNYDPKRPRRLLLTKKEIARLTGLQKERGLTIVPISMYSKSSLVKVGIGIARGKKKYDKREAIKKRDTQRDISREIGGRI